MMAFASPSQAAGAATYSGPGDEESPPAAQVTISRSGDLGRANVLRLVERAFQRRDSCYIVVILHRLLGTHGEMHLPVHYPLRFRLMAIVAFTASLWWVLNFIVSVLPVTTKASDGPCRFTDEQLRQNATVLFAYFVCFAVVRVFIFMPGVAARVAEIQSGAHGPWRLYALHMILHGPLYIFGIGSILFGLQLFMSPKCDGEPQDPELKSIFRYYAGYSCLVFAACLVLVYSHSKIISQAAARQAEDKRRAPPGTLEKLLTHIYDSEIFGDEDGKRYPGECPICLQEWEDGDQIKITPCHHAFHEDCIGHWLENERTCAFCRQDVTAPPLLSNRVIGAALTPAAAAASATLAPPAAIAATPEMALEAAAVAQSTYEEDVRIVSVYDFTAEALDTDIAERQETLPGAASAVAEDASNERPEETTL